MSIAIQTLSPGEVTAMMQTLAFNIDYAINGKVEEELPRRNGFCLMVFPLETHMGDCNYISNATKADISTLFKVQLAKWEGGMSEFPGHA